MLEQCSGYIYHYFYKSERRERQKAELETGLEESKQGEKTEECRNEDRKLLKGIEEVNLSKEVYLQVKEVIHALAVMKEEQAVMKKMIGELQKKQ